MRMSRKVVVWKPPYNEENGKKDETHELNGLAADSINCSNGQPVSRDGTGTYKNTISSSEVVKNLVDRWTCSVADSSEHGRAIQPKTVEGYIQKEPWASSAQKDFPVLPLAVESEEVLPAGLGDFQSNRRFASLGLSHFIRLAFMLSCHVSCHVCSGFLDISGNVEGISWGFRDGKAVVESSAGWDCSDT